MVRRVDTSASSNVPSFSSSAARAVAHCRWRQLQQHCLSDLALSVRHYALVRQSMPQNSRSRRRATQRASESRYFGSIRGQAWHRGRHISSPNESIGDPLQCSHIVSPLFLHSRFLVEPHLVVRKPFQWVYPPTSKSTGPRGVRSPDASALCELPQTTSGGEGRQTPRFSGIQFWGGCGWLHLALVIPHQGQKSQTWSTYSGMQL
mmetsp:Transcript_11787/g.21850  ORF Transcript_11787/g.21850 Transcript_11787/m.21850 type:complete len:205 (+) Transcript_11787:681-1295(+)